MNKSVHSSEPYAIHWFRRDLRIADNAALSEMLEVYKGRVVCIFSFDSTFLSRKDFSHARFGFFLQTLSDLQTQLQKIGGELLVLDLPPKKAFEWILEKASSNPPKQVSWNRDYEPFARERDKTIEAFLKSKGIDVFVERDHLLIEPEELLEGLDRGPYQVFSPFQRRWLELFSTPEVQVRLRSLGTPNHWKFNLKWEDVVPKGLPEGILEKFQKENARSVSITLPTAGAAAALKKVTDFSPKISAYGAKRDIPSVAGTSQLSIYFKNGSITNAQVIRKLELARFGKKAESGADKFLSELIWREFYYHILYFHPHVEKEAFQPRYNELRWQNRDDWFEAWKMGRTGYPIVDAGMRQLNETGWMHNRVRMIVASFLTKDLLIDWRWGEQYFMEKLLDGDLAPNNGGWQWAASTGCDPQPYFRIFNPYLQSKKFDPEGEYIRRWIPELKKLKASDLHDPEPVSGYPKPIVDHALQRDKALAMYNAVAKGKAGIVK